MAANEESSAQGAYADDAPRDATTEATRGATAFLCDKGGKIRGKIRGKGGKRFGKGGKALSSRAYPSKRPSMYGDESDASEDDEGLQGASAAQRPVESKGKRFGKLPRTYDDADDDEAASDDDDCTSNGSASMASKRVFRRRHGNEHMIGVCSARMRKMAKRAGVKMSRKEVHDVIREFVHNFVAGMVNDACAITSGLATKGKSRKTLRVGEMQFALQRVNRGVMV